MARALRSTLEAFCCPPTAPLDGAEETVMAKSQKRTNREIKKPKTAKPAVSLATSNLLTKGALAPNSNFKKKK